MADILSTKRTILSNPGVSRSDIYYNKSNTTVENVECTYNLGRFKQSLSNVSLGGQALITVPNSSFLEACYLYLELPATLVDQSIGRGWGYSIISNISYLWGSSNVSQLALNGHSLWQTISAQCQTVEKRSELWRLAGDEYLTAGNIPKACIQIPLPWSTACSGVHMKKPFDTNLLNSPITITIQFNSIDSIMGGVGLPRPTSFTKTEAVFRQGNLTNKNNSLKNVLAANSDLMLSYPFIHHQSYITPRFTAASSSLEISTVLQSFINADLVAITFAVMKSSDINAVGDLSPNPMNYQPLEDVRMLFNGEVMYDTSGSLYKLQNSHSITGAGYFQGSEIIAGTTTATFNSEPRDIYQCIVDFARIRSICYEGEYQNVSRYPNQVLELRFKLPLADPAETYSIYATYHYSAICEINNGQSNIYFS